MLYVSPLDACTAIVPVNDPTLRAQKHVDVLLKYVYAAMAIFEDGNGDSSKNGEGKFCNTLLAWHAKVRTQHPHKRIRGATHLTFVRLLLWLASAASPACSATATPCCNLIHHPV